jgi:hypothetical protein
LVGLFGCCARTADQTEGDSSPDKPACFVCCAPLFSSYQVRQPSRRSRRLLLGVCAHQGCCGYAGDDALPPMLGNHLPFRLLLLLLCLLCILCLLLCLCLLFSTG